MDTREKKEKRMGRSMRYSRPKTSPPETLLDFLCARFPYLSREGWVAHMEAGHLSVRTGRGEDVAPSVDYVLRQSDEISFSPPRELEPAVDDHICILHEDEAILVCAKSGNLPVAEGGRYAGNTLVGVLARRRAAFVGDGSGATVEADGTNVACHPVHRLDKETSGLVVLAKEATAARLLSRQFEQQSERLMEKVSQWGDSAGECVSAAAFGKLMDEEKVVTKSYVAVLAGAAPEGTVFIVSNRIGLLVDSLSGADDADVRNHAKLKKLKMACFPASVEENPRRHGRPAVSRVHIISTDTSLGVSVARVDILTGRTHQIRLHCAHLGFPVLGDKLYETRTPGLVGGCCAVADDVYIARARSDVGMTSEAAPHLRVKRHLLHAAVLAFCHPISGERQVFFSDPCEWILRDVVTEDATTEMTGSESCLAAKRLHQLLDRTVETLGFSRTHPSGPSPL